MGIRLGGRDVGSMRVDFYIPGNVGPFLPYACEIVRLDVAGGLVTAQWRHQARDVFVTLSLSEDDGLLSGSLAACGSGCVLIRLTWEMPNGTRGFPFVPGFMYGYNQGGLNPNATYPQLNSEPAEKFAQPWCSDAWYVRADRSTHGLAAVITDGFACAIGGRDVSRYPSGVVAEKNGLVIKGTDPQAISFSLGFANIPFTYGASAGCRNYFGRTEGYVNLDKGAVKSDFFMLGFQHNRRHEAAARLLRESYELMHDSVTGCGDLDKGVDDVSGAIVEYLYSDRCRMFLTGWSAVEEVTRQMDGQMSVGWVGGTSVAFPLLRAGRMRDCRKWIEAASLVMDNIAVNARSEKSGLFFENYDMTTGEWNARGWWYNYLEKPGHSGYVNGHACHYLLRAYMLESEYGVERIAWLDAARAVLDHVAEEQGDDGRFGYTYCEETGKILDGDGFSGCWFVPAFANLYRITREKRYLDIASNAMVFYRRYVEEFNVWGGPHDIHKSPDEEGILAFIEGARFLHEYTGDAVFLRDLTNGLDYEFSWKFSYNVVNEIEPLKSLNWCSTGGSVTSVNNSHIHPMGSQILEAMDYATRVTQDQYLIARLQDTLQWTLTSYAQYDGHYGWGKPGLINERFCYTDSLLLERWPDGSPASTWFLAHSWASGAVLEGLTGICDFLNDGVLPVGRLADRDIILNQPS